MGDLGLLQVNQEQFYLCSKFITWLYSSQVLVFFEFLNSHFFGGNAEISEITLEPNQIIIVFSA